MPEKISVVIPAYNAGATLKRCIDAVRRSTMLPDEIIVVDDCSTDSTVTIAEQAKCRVVELPTKVYQASSRNIGADLAKNDYLLFIDSDVIIKPDTIGHTFDHIASNRYDIVFASFDARCRFKNLVSQHKNLHMSFTQRSSKRDVKWTNTSFLMTRRSTFSAVNGFSEDLYKGICEDIDFGYRAHRAGYKILLDKSSCIVHDRYVSFGNFISNSYNRGYAIARMYHESRKLGDELEWPIVRSFVITSPILLLSLLLSLGLLVARQFHLQLAATMLSILAIIVINRKYFLFLSKYRGIKACLSFPLFCCDIFTNIVSVSSYCLHVLKSLMDGGRNAARRFGKARRVKNNLGVIRELRPH